jgi:hypothetical protein
MTMWSACIARNPSSIRKVGAAPSAMSYGARSLVSDRFQKSCSHAKAAKKKSSYRRDMQPEGNSALACASTRTTRLLVCTARRMETGEADAPSTTDQDGRRSRSRFESAIASAVNAERRRRRMGARSMFTTLSRFAFPETTRSRISSRSVAHAICGRTIMGAAEALDSSGNEDS